MFPWQCQQKTAREDGAAMVANNKREYYRLTLRVPLSARFRIIGYQNARLETNSSSIYIADIGAGGLRMHSRLNLPLNEGLLLEFNVELFHEELVILGAVLRKKPLQDGIYEYGVEFIMNDSLRQRLLSHLHMLSIRLRQTEVLASCSFVSEEEMRRFYGGLTDGTDNEGVVS
jgi:hypothetical protein